MSIQLSPHFTLEELTHSDSAIKYKIDNTPSSQVITNLTTLCHEVLEPLRILFDAPIHINSGFRCLALNTRIGSKPNSEHVTGNAVDFTVAGWTVHQVVDHIIDYGQVFNQLIAENGWTHISYNSVNKKQVLQATFDANGHATYTQYKLTK